MCNYSVSSNVSITKQINNTKEEVMYFNTEINKYDNFSHFWEENTKYLPLMTSLVRKVSIIPATSVASESAFSIAGYVARKQRSSLSSSSLKYSMLVRETNQLEDIISKFD